MSLTGYLKDLYTQKHIVLFSLKPFLTRLILNKLVRVKKILHKLLNCYIIPSHATGQTDSDFRTVFSNCGASGVSCYELDVVCKDFPRTEEDISKEAVIDMSIGDTSMTRSLQQRKCMRKKVATD